MVELGDKVRDLASGFEGIAIGRHDYLYGCVRITVAPKVDKTGKRVEPVCFDEGQLTVVKRAALQRPPSAEVRRGGPRDTPSTSRAGEQQ